MDRQQGNTASPTMRLKLDITEDLSLGRQLRSSYRRNYSPRFLIFSLLFLLSIAFLIYHRGHVDTVKRQVPVSEAGEYESAQYGYREAHAGQLMRNGNMTNEKYGRLDEGPPADNDGVDKPPPEKDTGHQQDSEHRENEGSPDILNQPVGNMARQDGETDRQEHGEDRSRVNEPPEDQKHGETVDNVESHNNGIVQGAEGLDNNGVVQGAEGLNNNVEGHNNVGLVQGAEGHNNNAEGRNNNGVVQGAEGLNNNSVNQGERDQSQASDGGAGTNKNLRDKEQIHDEKDITHISNTDGTNTHDLNNNVAGIADNKNNNNNNDNNNGQGQQDNNSNNSQLPVDSNENKMTDQGKSENDGTKVDNGRDDNLGKNDNENNKGVDHDNKPEESDSYQRNPEEGGGNYGNEKMLKGEVNRPDEVDKDNPADQTHATDNVKESNGVSKYNQVELPPQEKDVDSAALKSENSKVDDILKSSTVNEQIKTGDKFDHLEGTPRNETIQYGNNTNVGLNAGNISAPKSEHLVDTNDSNVTLKPATPGSFLQQKSIETQKQDPENNTMTQGSSIHGLRQQGGEIRDNNIPHMAGEQKPIDTTRYRSGAQGTRIEAFSSRNSDNSDRIASHSSRFQDGVVGPTSGPLKPWGIVRGETVRNSNNQYDHTTRSGLGHLNDINKRNYIASSVIHQDQQGAMQPLKNIYRNAGDNNNRDNRLMVQHYPAVVGNDRFRWRPSYNSDVVGRNEETHQFPKKDETFADQRNHLTERDSHVIKHSQLYGYKRDYAQHLAPLPNKPLDSSKLQARRRDHRSWRDRSLYKSWPISGQFRDQNSIRIYDKDARPI